MFWGVTLESGKRYSQVVDTSYHLSMAALEPRQGGEPVMVMLEHGKAEFLLCTLDQGNSRQVPLDLNFVEGEEVTFFLNGKGTVHLTGYLTDGLQDDESSDEELSLPDEEEQDEEDDLAMGDCTSQKQSKHAKKPQKPVLMSAFNGESEDESDTDFDVDQVEDETEDEEYDDDDAEEEALEEEEPQPLSLVQRKRLPQKRPADKALGNASPPAEKRASLMPSTSPEDTVAKKKRKKSKKQRSETPTADSNNAQVQPLPQGKAQTNKGISTQAPVGVVSTDLRVGSGPPAKPGRTMHIYYTGRLANNKVFDSCTSGKAFSFRLGKQDVIKGFNIGIQGMKVGGKRRLVIPPSQAYGNTRMGSIPPNSTLYFDVELKAVS